MLQQKDSFHRLFIYFTFRMETHSQKRVIPTKQTKNVITDSFMAVLVVQLNIVFELVTSVLK